MRLQRAALGSLCLALGGCAGDGSGLDENGRPIDEDAPPLQPTLASIQSNVFTPLCTGCHAGAAAPLGLRLEDGVAYAMLVNAPSVEAPTFLRVAPGDPDASYLVHKIEGAAAVGARMPLNAPPLPAETIAVIRQWIADGAPAQLAADASPPTLKSAWPASGAVLREPPREIILSADVELDASLLQAGVVRLRASGGDGDFADGDEIELPTRIELRTLAPTVLAVLAPRRAWRDDLYELRVSGVDPLALADRYARLIDGDGDGAAGGDFVLHFQIEELR